VHRDEYREPHAISGVVFHLRRGLADHHGPGGLSPLTIWPFIALLPWARFAFGLQAPISTCVISAFAERTVYITAASVRFPRLRLRIPRTLHALEQNLFSGRPNPGSTINHDGHSSHLRCNAPLVMDNPHCTLIRYLSVAARKSALNWPVVKSTSTWKISFPSLSPINRLASDLAPAIGTHASQGNGFDQRLAATPKDFSKVGASRFSSTDHSSFGSDHREQDDQGESTASCRHPLRHRLAR